MVEVSKKSMSLRGRGEESSLLDVVEEFEPIAVVPEDRISVLPQVSNDNSVVPQDAPSPAEPPSESQLPPVEEPLEELNQDERARSEDKVAEGQALVKPEESEPENQKDSIHEVPEVTEAHPKFMVKDEEDCSEDASVPQ